MFLDIIHHPLFLSKKTGGDRIQSLKRCVLKYKQDGDLDEDRTMDNAQKHYICINVQSSQNFRSYYPNLSWSRLRC
jgi:hypothetical protein